MKVSDVFHGTSLKACDLKGKEVTVTVKGYEVKEFEEGDRKEKKVELHFAESDRTLILNKINANTIAKKLEEDELERWNGAKITIYPTETEFRGEMVECIRVKEAFFEETPADAPF